MDSLEGAKSFSFPARACSPTTFAANDTPEDVVVPKTQLISSRARKVLSDINRAASSVRAQKQEDGSLDTNKSRTVGSHASWKRLFTMPNWPCSVFFVECVYPPCVRI